MLHVRGRFREFLYSAPPPRRTASPIASIPPYQGRTFVTAVEPVLTPYQHQSPQFTLGSLLVLDMLWVQTNV